jgi:hypothetical protein
MCAPTWAVSLGIWWPQFGQAKFSALTILIPPEGYLFALLDFALENFDAIVFVFEIDAFDKFLGFRGDWLSALFSQFEQFGHATGALIDEIGAKFVEIFGEGVHVLGKGVELDFDGVILSPDHAEGTEGLPLFEAGDDGVGIEVEVGAVGFGFANEGEGVLVESFCHSKNWFVGSDGHKT